jgi:hypothetical protein
LPFFELFASADASREPRRDAGAKRAEAVKCASRNAPPRSAARGVPSEAAGTQVPPREAGRAARTDAADDGWRIDARGDAHQLVVRRAASTPRDEVAKRITRAEHRERDACAASIAKVVAMRARGGRAARGDERALT